MDESSKPIERYKGVKAYKKAYNEGKVEDGDEIIVVEPDGKTGPFRYIVLNSAQLMSDNLARRVTNILHGKEWSLVKKLKNIDDLDDDF